ncbi:serine/threonine-protein kinase [Kribbella ginsengisoli]|uniref:serine/threonine-protein kinase n=1 Tax=Kribbella ginsengisoli TaxID=363865 RepID=UPI0031CEEE6C
MRSPGELGELVAGRYRLGDPVGRGGMGAVYRATDEVLGRDVAIKLLLPTREGPEAQERFKREARAAAMICDPYVVATYDFGPHQDGYYLAMELVEGHTLSVELNWRGPLEPHWAVEIVRQAAAGLAAAHQHGLVHRDIKPGNLLVTDDGLVKVADFGIVRILGDTTTTLTATGQVVGTSHYLAPERAIGKPAGAASDVYALGCVLYQLLTGHPPFQAEDAASIMYQHVQVTPTPPSELRPQCAGEAEALLFWMMNKDPAQRPTAAQVAAGVEPPALALTSVEQVLPVRRRPSRNLLVVAGAVLAVAATSTVGILIDSNSTKSPGPNDLQPSIPAAGSPSPANTTSGVPVARASTRPPTVASKTTARAGEPVRTAGTSVDATAAASAAPSAAPTTTVQPTRTKKPKPTKPTKTLKPHTTGKPTG